MHHGVLCLLVVRWELAREIGRSKQCSPRCGAHGGTSRKRSEHLKPQTRDEQRDAQSYINPYFLYGHGAPSHPKDGTVQKRPSKAPKLDLHLSQLSHQNNGI